MYRELAETLKHVAVTTVSPMDADGRLRLDAVPAQLERMAEGGIRIVVPCGNTGEFTSLTTDEAVAVIEATVGARPAGTTVVAGVGGASRTAVELAGHAERLGADAVMVHHPTHTYIDREALRGYYERILAATGLGVILYKRGPELSDELIAELAGHEQVVGVKYAVNDLNAFANLRAQASGEGTAWLCGSAERFAPFFVVAGAHGFTSGIANFAPRVVTDLYDALSAGDYRRAIELRQLLSPFEELRAARHNALNVSAVKEALRQVGLDTGEVRDPLRRLNADEAAQVTASLQAFGVVP